MRVCRVSVYERGAGGRRAAGMAEKRRGSPCSMLSLKAHAFSVEALIGAEKQQQLQKKRRKLDAEEAAGAVDDGGCSRGGEKGSPERDEGAALPPPAGAASGPARGCADLELSCGSRGAAGESAPCRPTSLRRVPSQVLPASTAAGEHELPRVVAVRDAPEATRPLAHWPWVSGRKARRCPGCPRRAARVTLQTVSTQLPASLFGLPPPSRRSRSQPLLLASCGRAGLCFPRLPPLGVQPSGALFFFPSF